MNNHPSQTHGKGRGRQPARRPARASTAATPFTADELREISEQITSEWFRPVDPGHLTLLEIDPWRVHAYWNLQPDSIAAARASLPHDFGNTGQQSALVLRFTDLSPETGGAAHHPRFDIEVEGASNNWYVDLWRDAKRYSAELGLRAADGTFVSLARSNEVATPRGGPSPELAFRPVAVRAQRPDVVHAPSAVGADTRNEALLQDLYPQRLAPDDGYPLAAAEGAGEWFDEPAFPSLDSVPTDTDIPEPMDPPAIATEPAAGRQDAAADAAGFPLIDAAQIDQYRSAARQARQRALAEIPAHLPPVTPDSVAPTDVDLVPQPLPVWLDAAAAPEPGDASPLPEPADGSQQGAPGGSSTDTREAEIRASDRFGHRLDAQPGVAFPTAGSGTLPAPVALESLLAGIVSSPGRGSLPIEASAHLLIEGKSTLDRPLTLFGEPVETQPDGSFRVQQPLQHGPDLAELLYRLRARHDYRKVD